MRRPDNSDWSHVPSITTKNKILGPSLHVSGMSKYVRLVENKCPGYKMHVSRFSKSFFGNTFHSSRLIYRKKARKCT